MEISGKKILVCDCEGTMALDGKTLARACGSAEARINSQLCRSEIDNFRQALGDGQPVVVACTQEAPFFTEVLLETNASTSLTFTNIRERAAWSEAGEVALPKIAALLAEAALEIPGTGSITIKSEGRVLVYGRDEVAINAAAQLAGRLAPTVLLKDPGEIIPPRLTQVLTSRGDITKVEGHFGAFEILVDGHAPARPSSRDVIEFGGGRDGVRLTCDLILDLSGEAPLFAAGEKRDGYYKPNPSNPALVQKALYDIADMIGEFEKPLYVAFDETLCAHARSNITGCTRCIDVCPLSAISPGEEAVTIDAFACGGCGGCASVCPTGASSYAMPPGDALFQRLRTLLGRYREAGGEDPVLLVHDARFGDEMITMMGRHGRGLPANVLPFALNEVTQVGLDFLALALAYGANRLLLLVAPEKQGDVDGLAAQIGLAETALAGFGYGSGRVELLAENDPTALEEHLWSLGAVAPFTPASFLPMGGKRTRVMLGLRHLNDHAPEPRTILPLPKGAPFGTVEVDVGGCTLCLACVGACPTGALIDNPDKPMLRFNEEACIQCGLCLATCPESVMSLAPRLNFSDEARSPIVVNEEEPFHCVSCGKPFGTKGSIERMVERLADHPMFANKENSIDRIKMCEDCRVAATFAEEHPMASTPRPKVRTTEDYLREREEGREGGEDED